MSFELVELSVLNVCKVRIHTLAGLAEHYFLSECNRLDTSVGWGPTGLELRGKVRVTSQELERIERFVAVARYRISVNNCEHFANYVLHGLNISSQQQVWWKSLGANTISCLQLTQSASENYQEHICKQIAEVLNQDLRQATIEKANRERIEFWKARGVDVEKAPNS